MHCHRRLPAAPPCYPARAKGMVPDSCLTATRAKAARCFPVKRRHRSACEIARVCPESWKLHVLNLAGLPERLAIVLSHSLPGWVWGAWCSRGLVGQTGFGTDISMSVPSSPG